MDLGLKLAIAMTNRSRVLIELMVFSHEEPVEQYISGLKLGIKRSKWA